jgi:copper homeostasis protein
MLIEICAFNIQSCYIAERAGASRIELCAGALYGGITPGIGTIKHAMEHISIPVYPMIRPRGGNFVYDADELAIMKKDIIACKELGCPGIATGAQLPGGRINTEVMKLIVAWAYPMEVTCHKAFDATPNAFLALEELIFAGCRRVLTSGMQKTAIEGAETLARLITLAAGRIIVMPGGGVRSSNIAQLIKATGATEYHSSAIASRGTNDIADDW